jgi:hypothetical protein
MKTKAVSLGSRVKSAILRAVLDDVERSNGAKAEAEAKKAAIDKDLTNMISMVAEGLFKEVGKDRL